MNESTMSQYVSLLARIAALQAEIQAMATANSERQFNGEAMAYDSDAFFYVSSQLNDLSDEALRAGNG